MWTLAFWRATIERALKTVAQTAAATIGTTAVIQEVEWSLVAGASAIAGVLSVLTSIGTAAMTDGSPSAGGAEKLTGS